MALENGTHLMAARQIDLITSWNLWLARFNEGNPFTGPSLHFHKKTLEILRKYRFSLDALYDDLYFDYLYATLASWGMHRMGRGGPKLRDLEVIREGFMDLQTEIEELLPYKLTQIDAKEFLNICEKLWQILSRLVVSRSRIMLIANSKALHHLLPDLVPPIDRQYSLRFFFNHNRIYDEKRQFIIIYMSYYAIAHQMRESIANLVRESRDWNTSETKVIDNAIIGYVLANS